jgi:hypothetical protein
MRIIRGHVMTAFVGIGSPCSPRPPLYDASGLRTVARQDYFFLLALPAPCSTKVTFRFTR